MEDVTDKLEADSTTISHKIWKPFQDYVALSCCELLIVETRLKIASRHPKLKPNGKVPDTVELLSLLQNGLISSTIISKLSM